MSGASTTRGLRPRYRRRRPLPALLVLSLLVVLSGFMWTRVFETAENTETATRCNPPSPTRAPDKADQAALGEMLPRTALDQVSPIAPQNIKVRVLNGNGESKQASMISEELSRLEFGQGGEAEDDSVYPNYDLNCHGQIRFGGAGTGAARTLSLMTPCAQLVRDDRKDATIDLALGAEFDDIKTTPEAKRVFHELAKWGARQPEQGAAKQGATGDQQVGAPRFTRQLLSEAREVSC